MLVRFDHTASFIVDANHSIMGSAEKLCVCDCVPMIFAIPQATDWQRIGNQINAVMIFTGTDFAKVRVIFHDSLSTVRQISRANSASSRNTEKLALC